MNTSDESNELENSEDFRTIGYNFGKLRNKNQSVEFTEEFAFQSQTAIDIISYIQNVLDHESSLNLTIFDKYTKKGFLRSVMIRESIRTKEILMNFCTKDSEGNEYMQDLFKNLFIDKLLLHNNESCQKNPSLSKIVGILQTALERDADISELDPNRIFTKTLYGRDWFYEIVNSKKIQVGAGCFLQNNINGLDRIINIVLDYFKEISSENTSKNINLLEIYSGLSLYSQFLLTTGKVKECIAVETNPESLIYARKNTPLFENNEDTEEFDNKTSNLKLVNKHIQSNLYRSIKFFNAEDELFLLVNPPRSGIPIKVGWSIIKNLKIKYLVYITCDLRKSYDVLTLMLKKGPFKIKNLDLIDMFPKTDKFETVILLERVDVLEKEA